MYDGGQNHAGTTVLPVDGHVHFHRPSLVAPTLDAAVGNFQRVAAGGPGLAGALLLTQASGETVFEALCGGSPAGAWALSRAAGEPETLIAHRDGTAVAIVCGRQVRAEGGLEVLALGTTRTFSDGRSLADTVAEVSASGAVSVLPWGFGKWLGERGERIRSALRAVGPAILFVGDNGSRLALAPLPALISEAAQQGFRVLPGTDPFPFGGDHRRVGGFGFIARVDAGRESPWRALREWLLSSQDSPPRYGSALGPARFIFNQAGVQIYNRIARKGGL